MIITTLLIEDSWVENIIKEGMKMQIEKLTLSTIEKLHAKLELKADEITRRINDIEHEVFKNLSTMKDYKLGSSKLKPLAIQLNIDLKAVTIARDKFYTRIQVLKGLALIGE